MEIAFLYFVFSIFVGLLASSRGRTGLIWFFVAIFVSPLIAGILVLLLENKQSAKKLEQELELMRQTHVKCPDCAELVKKEARVCKHCSCKLIPQ